MENFGITKKSKKVAMVQHNKSSFVFFPPLRCFRQLLEEEGIENC